MVSLKSKRFYQLLQYKLEAVIALPNLLLLCHKQLDEQLFV